MGRLGGWRGSGAARGAGPCGMMTLFRGSPRQGGRLQLRRSLRWAQLWRRPGGPPGLTARGPAVVVVGGGGCGGWSGMQPRRHPGGTQLLAAPSPAPRPFAQGAPAGDDCLPRPRPGEGHPHPRRSGRQLRRHPRAMTAYPGLGRAKVTPIYEGRRKQLMAALRRDAAQGSTLTLEG